MVRKFWPPPYVDVDGVRCVCVVSRVVSWCLNDMFDYCLFFSAARRAAMEDDSDSMLSAAGVSEGAAGGATPCPYRRARFSSIDSTSSL